jgi:Ser/Thr protein kinase RdoA (MazF antagonist)
MDATVCSEESLREAAVGFVGEKAGFQDDLCRFVAHFLLGPFTFEKCSGGVNNRVYKVKTNDGRTFVLRVYNNGGNSARVEYEHAILRFLEGSSLFFAFPQLVRVLGSSATSVKLKTMDAEACMFAVLPGTPAPVSSEKIAESAGRATALLVATLAKLDNSVTRCIVFSCLCFHFV